MHARRWLTSLYERTYGLERTNVVGSGHATVATGHCATQSRAIRSGAVIAFHNHPLGDPTPSGEDTELTQRLREAGRILGIEVLDHRVLGDEGRYFSFKERGLP